MIQHKNFYPRSPCGERLNEIPYQRQIDQFLSTLSLRRATGGFAVGSWRLVIFLSTLSLRRATDIRPPNLSSMSISIHALLAESDRPRQIVVIVIDNFYPRSPCGERHAPSHNPCSHNNFYPRSPCGERQRANSLADTPPQFLSTLSLRRATEGERQHLANLQHFYPRSPCGERLGGFAVGSWPHGIFLSTLSLRRATRYRINAR